MSDRPKARSIIHNGPAPMNASGHLGDPPPREFLSVAIRITAATGGKDGFFVQLFPDQRGPQSIYVSIGQLDRMLALAIEGLPENEVWAELAKIPLEPLAPARSLYLRFKNLLQDCAPMLREEILRQRERAEARARPDTGSEQMPASPDAINQLPRDPA